MKIRTTYSPLALFAWQPDDAPADPDARRFWLPDPDRETRYRSAAGATRRPVYLEPPRLAEEEKRDANEVTFTLSHVS
jgi:hypothetical protein